MKQGKIHNSERWLYGTLKPGRDPLEALAALFSRLKSPELGKYFREHAHEPTALNECAESVLSERKDQRLVLFIDQFEEIFTQVDKEPERTAILALLTHAATVESGRVILLFSMRSDFVSNCATYPQLNALLNQQFIQIGAMQSDELVSAIAQPALRAGLGIDPDLIAQIINDMKGEPGALPLMQFALKDLFNAEQTKGNLSALTCAAYLERGGIHKSLERHADSVFATLSADEQELARSIFSGLIEIGRGTQDTKRTALFDELIPANSKASVVESIVQKLADARLITTDESVVTISHEKLIDAWPWLKKLVNENRDVIALQNEIAADAKEWEERKRDASYLYTGGRLATVREQFEKQKLALSHLAQEFVRAGRLRQQRTRTALISAVSVVLIAAIVASVAFQNSAQTNAENANLANTQQAIAQANADEAKKQTTIALARQLASQAQAVYTTNNFRQMISALLDIQSMKLFPNRDAASFLLNDNHSAALTSRMTHDGPVNSVAFSPDGKYVVSVSVDNTARVWEAASGEEVARMTHDGPVYSVAFSPDGKYVVSGSADTTARGWEAASGEEIAPMTHDGWVSSVAFSPDGKYVVSGSADTTARVWEAASGEEVARMTHDGIVISVAFSRDGKYVVSGGDTTARVWEAASGKEIARMTHDSWVYSVAFSPDGKYVVSGGDDATARVWEAASGEEVARMTHDGIVTSVAFSPDGKYVVSGSRDNTARVWKAASGEEVTRMTHDSFVASVAFSPEGKYVVSGSYDATARVWEAASGEEVARMTHDGIVTSVAFSPDGKYVVSGADITVRVWEAASGKEIALMSPDSWVSSIAFSPDGKYLVSGSEDNTARVWVWQAGDLIASACAVMTRNLTRTEWKLYIGDALPYQAVCPNLPLEPEATPTSSPTSTQ